MNAPTTPELTMSEQGSRRDGRRGRLVRLVILAVVLGAGVWFGAKWFHDRQVHVFIIDSRIASDMVTISAQEAGRVVDLQVGTQNLVRRNCNHFRRNAE